jgi:hypothetical protein
VVLVLSATCLRRYLLPPIHIRVPMKLHRYHLGRRRSSTTPALHTSLAHPPLLPHFEPLFQTLSPLPTQHGRQLCQRSRTTTVKTTPSRRSRLFVSTPAPLQPAHRHRVSSPRSIAASSSLRDGEAQSARNSLTLLPYSKPLARYCLVWLHMPLTLERRSLAL